MSDLVQLQTANDRWAVAVTQKVALEQELAEARIVIEELRQRCQALELENGKLRRELIDERVIVAQLTEQIEAVDYE